MEKDYLLAGLNSEQQEVVLHDEGPLLVAAVAGSDLEFRGGVRLGIQHFRRPQVVWPTLQPASSRYRRALFSFALVREAGSEAGSGLKIASYPPAAHSLLSSTAMVSDRFDTKAWLPSVRNAARNCLTAEPLTPPKYSPIARWVWPLSREAISTATAFAPRARRAAPLFGALIFGQSACVTPHHRAVNPPRYAIT